VKHLVWSAEDILSFVSPGAKTLLVANRKRMKASASPVVSPQGSIGARVRTLLIASAFAVVLLVPKILRLRHNPQTWLAFRIMLAIAGASLVIVPLSFATSWFAAILGLAIFLAAILLPPAKEHDPVAERTKELGALVVVNGGDYQPAHGSVESVQLFVSSDEIFVLDSKLQTKLRMPVAEISSVNAATETPDRWILRVRWRDQTADFRYQGIFAEHLARVAESTLRSVMRLPLPMLPQRRAAGA
jgi:hypothetical protein